MTPASRRRDAFSLVEVIMAVGIVAFALVAMLALMGSMLGNARDTATQNDALQMVPSINEYLKKAGFTSVYGWAVSPSNQPLILAYNVETNQRLEQIVTNVAGAGNAPATVSARAGRLFQVKLAFSTNNPAGLANAPSAVGTYTNFALPLQVKIYNSPTAEVAVASNNLVMSYETAVFR